MHIVRSGESEDIVRLDPMLIDYVQISDGPISVPDPQNYMSEAMNERMVPGTGEMPLVEMIRAIRRDVVVSIEVPMRSLKRAGMSEGERVRLAVDGARRSEERRVGKECGSTCGAGGSRDLEKKQCTCTSKNSQSHIS